MRISDWSSDVCSSDLLELLAIVIAGGVFDLGTDRFGTALDRVGITGAIDERGVVLVDRDALGGAEHAERDVFELDPETLGDDFALAQDRDVLEHRLAAIAEARRLPRGALQHATQHVYDERGQRPALDVPALDPPRTTRLAYRFEDRPGRPEG